MSKVRRCLDSVRQGTRTIHSHAPTTSASLGLSASGRHEYRIARRDTGTGSGITQACGECRCCHRRNRPRTSVGIRCRPSGASLDFPGRVHRTLRDSVRILPKARWGVGRKRELQIERRSNSSSPPRRRGRHTEQPPQIAGARVEPRPVRCHVQCHLEGIADRIERAASGDPHLLGAPTAFELEDQRPASHPRAPRQLCPRAPKGPGRRCAPARPRAWAPPTRTAKAALLVERILEAVQPEALDPALGLRLGAQLKTRPA